MIGTEPVASQIPVRLLEPFGAEIDLDLSKALNSDLIDMLRAAFDQHHMLVFRNQDLSMDRQRAFMANFGPVNIRDLAMVSNDEKRGGLGKIELGLHSDASFTAEPLLAGSFFALDVDSHSTSTIFQDSVRAYRRLPEPVKKKLAALQVRHAMAKPNPITPDNPSHVHPAIMAHPKTGEPILYVNVVHSVSFIGMPKEESDALLLELCAEARRDNVYEHTWHLGDFVMWDNRACCHGRGAVSDAPRTFQRVALGKGLEQVENAVVQVYMASGSQ
jgi:taurine dioxygenase